MLRRTQADILNKLLPPRTDYVIYCGATASQAAEYEAVAGDIKRCACYFPVVKFPFGVVQLGP